MAEERVQRRLAAILAADVVGYSRMMERDEAGTLGALKARRGDILQPLVTKHHGRIVKVMGDGVLVEFGSAVNAVECAIELQQAMGAANQDVPEDLGIVLRVGINLGDVMVEGGDIYGDGVNVAARLEALADPGGVLVSQTVYGQVRGKVPLAFEDIGEQRLKNIAESVRAYRVSGTEASSIATSSSRPELLPKPSIAVLPFSNLSGDPDQAYFSDGITEDIITELSRFSSLLIVARNSTFQYRSKGVDLRRVGRELGAKYIVEGSVRRLGAQIRITAQLIDSETGQHLWADRYDRKIDDLFDTQDEVVRAIVFTLEHRVANNAAIGARRKVPQNWTAYDYVLQARQASDRFDITACEVPLRRAIELDPTLAEAYARLCGPICFKYFEDGNSAHLKEAFELAKKTIAIDDRLCISHSMLGWVYMQLGQFDLADVHYAQALL
jgi:TolB-like protein/class 3 adenylate cyclase